jgi:hypothetical protein
MPSPFPGMDPYLENRTLWPSVHHDLICEIQGELNRQLRPRYRASIEERVYLSDEDDPGQKFVVPDVHVTKRGHPISGSAGSALGRISLIEPVEITSIIEDEIHEPRIEILDGVNRAVVTVIEVMSITNKLTGSYGRESYLQKRRDVMRSPVHLVEIDLLRTGVRMHVPERLKPHEYRVHISRAQEPNGRRATVWPIPITLPLPVIPIPLKIGDTDAQIDLQKMLELAYERDACDMAIDYTVDPLPPLTDEHATWARQQIARWKADQAGSA